MVDIPTIIHLDATNLQLSTKAKVEMSMGSMGEPPVLEIQSILHDFDNFRKTCKLPVSRLSDWC